VKTKPSIEIQNKCSTVRIVRLPKKKQISISTIGQWITGGDPQPTYDPSKNGDTFDP